MDRVVERAVKRRRHLGAQAWHELFERFGSAGLTVEEFCRREGVCRSSFNRWRKQLQAEGTAHPAPATKARSAKRAAPFVDLGVLGAAGGLELRIELGGGVTLVLARR
jgi:transposase-like protein